MRYLIILLLFGCTKEQTSQPIQPPTPQPDISITIQANANAEWNIRGIYTHYKRPLMVYDNDDMMTKVTISKPKGTILFCQFNKGELSKRLKVLVTSQYDTLYFKTDSVSQTFNVIY